MKRAYFDLRLRHRGSTNLTICDYQLLVIHCLLGFIVAETSRF